MPAHRSPTTQPRPRADRPVVRHGLASAAAGALAAALPAFPATSAMATAEPPAPEVELRPAGVAVAEERRLMAALAPVADEGAALPPQLSVADLIKAAGLAEAAAEEERVEAAAECPADTSGLGAVKPWVRSAAQFLSCLHDEPTLIGVASRGSGTSDHPSGHALDLMTDRDQGDRVAACALANQDELGVDYVIWRQRVNHGDGWQPMADRGSATANHFDHVHISFDRSAPDGDPSAAACL